MTTVPIDTEELEALRGLERMIRRGAPGSNGVVSEYLRCLDAIRARAKQAEARRRYTYDPHDPRTMGEQIAAQKQAESRSRLAPYLECGRCRYRGDETITDPDCPLHGSKP